MHSSEVQTGVGGTDRRVHSHRNLAVRALILLFALASVALLSASPAAAIDPADKAGIPEPPMNLPSDAGISSRQPGNNATSWIVGGLPGEATAEIASRFNASAVNGRLGSYEVPRTQARAFAAKLKSAGLLAYAEPDVKIDGAGYPFDLLTDQQWWLNRIVSPSDVTPPTATPSSPLIALIEESLDPAHPDLSQANLTGAISLSPSQDTHGTSIAGIVGSPGEMLGIRGVWPGARMRLYPSGLKCSSASEAVTKAANQGAAVINMSYTFPANVCFTHFKATQYAVRKGSIPVAAAGNSGATGNAPVRPAIDPHVISVGAVDDATLIAPFSTRNSGVDLVAPGVNVLAPVVSKGGDSAGQSSSKVTYDWQAVSGTSFAAPMVSAVAAWIKQLRPNLGNLQIAKILTSSATDLGDPGRDPYYGEGLLSIEKSMVAPVPVADPFEPNDDIRWLNGSQIKPKAPYFWRGGMGKRRILTATMSRAKDPADVYRVLIPPRQRVVINVVQLEGDVVVSALKPSAKSLSKPKGKLFVQSNRPYPKTEGIVVRNLQRKARPFWLAITPAPADAGNNFTYQIKLVRR